MYISPASHTVQMLIFHWWEIRGICMHVCVWCVCAFLHRLSKINNTKEIFFISEIGSKCQSLLLSGSCDSTMPASIDVSSHTVEVFTEMSLSSLSGKKDLMSSFHSGTGHFCKLADIAVSWRQQCDKIWESFSCSYKRVHRWELLQQKYFC